MERGSLGRPSSRLVSPPLGGRRPWEGGWPFQTSRRREIFFFFFFFFFRSGASYAVELGPVQGHPCPIVLNCTHLIIVYILFLKIHIRSLLVQKLCHCNSRQEYFASLPKYHTQKNKIVSKKKKKKRFKKKIINREKKMPNALTRSFYPSNTSGRPRIYIYIYKMQLKKVNKKKDVGWAFHTGECE